jgi:RNA polymerase sigma-70 factor (ECF subfamily)
VDEKGLVQQAKQGDESAFEVLVHQNVQYVFNLAVRLVNDPSEAEDIAQEAFIRAWKALPNFRMEARFSTWLYRIVTNLCYDRLPNLKKELIALEIDETIDLPDDFIKPESYLLSKELQEELYSAIGELPASYRLLITLRHLQEMSYAEIAEATMQPIGTVKTGIFRARQLLRQRIELYEARYG